MTTDHHAPPGARAEDMARLAALRSGLDTLRREIRGDAGSATERALLRRAADALDTDPATAARAAGLLAGYLRDAAHNAEVRERPLGIRYRQRDLAAIAALIVGGPDE